MVEGVSSGYELRDLRPLHEMNEPTVVDEYEVELCLELARLYDTQDLTHPPFRGEDTKEEEDGE